jgi:hypothetical protein
VVVCDARKNALLKAGNKNDRIDARELADWLQAGLLSRVYHEEFGVRMLKELARSYLAITKDPDTGKKSHQSGVPELGDPLRGTKSVFAAVPQSLAETTAGNRGAAARRTVVSGIR